MEHQTSICTHGLRVITLKVFLEHLRSMGMNAQSRRDFHIFMLRKHDENPAIWPLEFTMEQGSLFIWNHVFNLWQHNQIVTNSICIIVNGKKRPVYERWLAYTEVADIAFPERTGIADYTMTYHKKGGGDRSMVTGDQVEVTEGMVFNVARTNNG